MFVIEPSRKLEQLVVPSWRLRYLQFSTMYSRWGKPNFSFRLLNVTQRRLHAQVYWSPLSLSWAKEGMLSLGQWEGLDSAQIRDQLALRGTKDDEHVLRFSNVKTFVTWVVREYLFSVPSSVCIPCVRWKGQAKSTCSVVNAGLTYTVSACFSRSRALANLGRPLNWPFYFKLFDQTAPLPQHLCWYKCLNCHPLKRVCDSRLPDKQCLWECYFSAGIYPNLSVLQRVCQLQLHSPRTPCNLGSFCVCPRMI